jgi:hypothetical protein
METKVKQLIKEYEMLITLCDVEISSPGITFSLELYVKGKKHSYERFIVDLKTLI